MKKTLLIASVALFTFSIFTTSCKKDNPIDCASKLIEVSNAQSDYIVNDTYDNCIAYKNALQDYINCDGITDKTYYQELYDNLTCN